MASTTAKIIRFALTGGFAFGAAFGLGPGSADSALAATDKKAMSGLACQPQTGTSGTIRYSSGGYVYNDSSSNPLSVVCPVAVDTNGAVDLTDTRVWVVDNNSGTSTPDNVTCWIKGVDAGAGGSIIWTRGTSETQEGGSGLGTYSLGFHTGSGTPSYIITDLENFFLECDIPHKDSGRSKVYGMMYEENFN